MGTQLILLLATSVVTSAVTLGAAWALYRKVWEPRLDARLLELQDEFERRVKSGVLAAGEELLPAFRQTVADGFRDALRDLHPAGLAGDAAKAVGGAAEVLGQSLGNLFGLKPRK